MSCRYTVYLKAMVGSLVYLKGKEDREKVQRQRCDIQYKEDVKTMLGQSKNYYGRECKYSRNISQ